MDDWLKILKEECSKSSITKVAARLGYARSSISLVVHGRYPGDPHKVRARVIERLVGKITCPHSGEVLTAHQCVEIHGAPMPTSSAKKLRQWSACRDCPHRNTTTNEES